MNQLLVTLRHDMFDPDTLTGAVLLGIIFLLAATMIVRTLRRATRHVESHLSDVTGVHFASALGQVFAYLIAFVLYAHLVPGLRALGTALLAGVSVVSVVLGLAAGVQQLIAPEVDEAALAGERVALDVEEDVAG